MKRLVRLPTLLIWLLPLGFLGLFYFYPLVDILSLSFARLADGLKWADLPKALGFTQAFDILGFTFYQALLSTLLTLLAGLPGAYLFARFDFRGKALLRAFTGIPFVLPTLVVAAGFSALLGPQGWLNRGLAALMGSETPPIQFLNTLGAILLAHVFYNTTIVLRVVGDYWARLDPRLEQAARTLGASRTQAFLKVTLPLLLPALLAAGLLVFIFDFSSFAVVLVLGGPRFATLETEIYYQVTALFNLPAAAFLSLLQLACTLGLTIIYSRLSARLSAPGRLRSRQVTQAPLVTWKQWAMAIAVLTPLLLLLGAPLVALALRSVVHLGPTGPRDAGVEAGFTLVFFQALFENRQGSALYIPPILAVFVSTGYALLTVIFSLGLGLPAAWVLARPQASSRIQYLAARLLDPLLMLPLGTSAVTLGLGFLVAFDRPPLDLRLSPLLVPLAHTLVAFPFVVRSLTPALRSIQPRLRQAALVLGASPWQAWRYVDLPLAARAVTVAAAFAFTISLGEFGATALIARPEFPTLPMAIYRLISRPGALNYGQALALSTILMLVAASAMFAIERFRIGDGQEF